MTTILKVHLDDLDSKFLQNLKEQFGKETEVEIRLRDNSSAEDLFSEDDFWKVIDLIDWTKKTSKEQLQPAVKYLSERPVSNIFIFADKLSEKLYRLDTRQHAYAYAANEPDQFISVDDFLYVRCAVIAEGREYYEKVLNDPAQMPNEIVFEPLLSLADRAYELQVGSEFNYFPAFNYETRSNQSGWE
ncbi:MAG: DUF4240 domain-containing protein [Saprospirales bacterium]|nr:DUF4240 domain-containing protein [Saprospirales bacterium]